MNIAIVGTGNMGGNLARRLTQLGHQVAISNSRGPHTLKELAAETGAEPRTIAEVAKGAEAIIIVIPFKNISNLPDGFLNEAAPGAVVIDANNYFPKLRDGQIDDILAGLPESRWVEQQINYPVIKALNAVGGEDFLTKGTPAGTNGRIAVPVAGDDQTRKATAIQLINELGFDTVDAGGLDESWRFQPGKPSTDLEHDAESLRAALSEASPVRSPEL